MKTRMAGRGGLVVALAATGMWLRLAAAQDESSTAGDVRETFSRLPVWDDGLSEMSYYDATETIYGVERKYTRVHLLNRQWMSAADGVKVEPSAADAVAVFKLNIAEEIPTENYNYRYLTTVFVKRQDLSPFKMAVSSQEWCGASYKHLRWRGDSLTVQSFGYFPGEGERSWKMSGAAAPFESLVVLARSVVAAGQGRSLELLRPMRSTHEVTPTAGEVRLELGDGVERIRVPAGWFEVRRVTLSPSPAGKTYFDVEIDAPYRLIAFQMDDVTGRLRGVERRAYWDRSSTNRFFRPGAAP